MRTWEMPAETPRQWEDRHENTEAQDVHLWRFHAARKAGLTLAEAHQFAAGDGDIEALRTAKEHGATHDQLVDIFL